LQTVYMHSLPTMCAGVFKPLEKYNLKTSS